MVMTEFRGGELTVSGAARRADVSEYAIRHGIETGSLVVERAGGRIKIRVDDLERWLSNRPVR